MSSQLSSNIQPGSVVENRNRLWRVDAVDGNVVTATPLDGNTADRHRFYTPVENIEEGSLEPPDPENLSNPEFQRLLNRAYRLSMLHGTAPLVSLQRSRVIPTEGLVERTQYNVNDVRYRLTDSGTNALDRVRELRN